MSRVSARVQTAEPQGRGRGEGPASSLLRPEPSAAPQASSSHFLLRFICSSAHRPSEKCCAAAF